MLLLGSAAALLGVLLRDWLAGLLWERVGLLAVVPAIGVYVILAFESAGWRAASVSVLSTAAIIVGGTARLVQIHRFVRGMHAAAAGHE